MKARGFTLIEVLAVTAILALAVSVVGVRVGLGGDAARRARAVRDAVDADRRARLRARVDGEAVIDCAEAEPRRVAVDARGRSVDARWVVASEDGDHVVAWEVLGRTGLVVPEAGGR
ncbi:MAG: type II secretion system protein [Planctomycetota bacterium JB042]